MRLAELKISWLKARGRVWTHGKQFKSIRVHFTLWSVRSDVEYMCFAELKMSWLKARECGWTHRKQFKSIRVHFMLWRCLYDALQPGPSWTHGYIYIYIYIYILNTSEFHSRCEAFFMVRCCWARAELMGIYVKYIRGPFTLWSFIFGVLQPGQSWTHGYMF